MKIWLFLLCVLLLSAHLFLKVKKKKKGYWKMLPTPHTRKCLFSSAKCVVIRCTVRCITWGKRNRTIMFTNVRFHVSATKSSFTLLCADRAMTEKTEWWAHCQHPQLRDKKREREGERESYSLNSLNEKRIKVHETKCLMGSGRIKFLFHQLVSICSGR